MSFSKFSASFYLLTCALLLRTVLGADPLNHICLSNQNFTANGPYQTSLSRLMGYFYYQAPPTGFALGTLGQYNLDRPYGLALCRGDISPKDCRTCVHEAETEIAKLCPYNKGGIIWYDNCLLKYSDDNFFGQIDDQNQFSLVNVQNVSDPVTFNQKTNELLSQLAQNASASEKMYAAGELEMDEASNSTTTKIYGLVQCTRDLSSDDCKKCLDGAIGELPGCCDGKQGGRVVGGSCNVGYEIYPFFNV